MSCTLRHGVRKQEIISDHGGVLEPPPHTRKTARRLLSLVRRIVHAISGFHRRCERVSPLPRTQHQFQFIDAVLKGRELRLKADPAVLDSGDFWPALHHRQHCRGFSEPSCGTRRLQRQIPQKPSHSALEAITWCSPSNPPDADTTVLVFLPEADEPVDFGFWDGERWCCDTLRPREESRITAWAEMPEGRIP